MTGPDCGEKKYFFMAVDHKKPTLLLLIDWSISNVEFEWQLLHIANEIVF